jgi:hypothetical protein
MQIALKHEVQITIAGKEYPMCYTTAAVIAKRRIVESKGEIAKLPTGDQLETMIEIATVMINGAIAAHNLAEGKNEPLITPEHISLLATEDEVTKIFAAVAEISSEEKRSVKTAEDPEEKKDAAE